METARKIKTRTPQHSLITTVLSLVLLVPWLATGWLAAAESPNYTRHVWHVTDGLPEDTVQALSQTPDGYLLVGTTGGMARFDGSHFHLYTHTPSIPLGDTSIFCMLKAHDQTTWLGTEGGGLVHLDPHGYRVYSTPDGLSDLFVRALLEDDAGNIWVGTDNGLFRVRLGKLERIDTAPLAPSMAVHAIMEDRAHHIWVGGSQLLVFDMHGDDLQGTTASKDLIRLVHLPGRDSLARVKALLQTSDGTIWAGTVDGLDRMTGGRFTVVPQITGTVRSLYQTSDGTLWIGTIGHGLWRFAGSAFSSFDSNGLLPSKTVLCIFEDASHQVWVGTQEGLVRLSETAVSLLPLPGGSDPDFATISADPDGTIWAVFSRVFAIRDGVAKQYHFPQIPDVPIRSIFRARDRSLWVGTDGDGVYHIDGHAVRHYASPATLSNNFVRAFLQDHDGTMWIALDDGLSHIFHDGSVRNYGMKDGLAYFSMRALVQESDGDLWFGTERGVSHMQAGKFVYDKVTETLAQEKVWSILQDSGGALWFGTRNHGLYRYAQGRLVRYTTTQGLADNSIYQLLERSGSLWLSGPNEISSLRLSQMQHSASSTHLAVETWELPYEAAGALLYGGRQPSGCIGADQSIWFPSSKGALRVLPRKQADAAPPRSILLSVTVDGSELPLAAKMLLPASTARLEIGFTPILLRSQQGLRFRYKLDDLDRGWNYAGIDRIASYTNLAAGKYKLTVQAFELADPDAFTESVLLLEKRPYFYETWWFAAALLAAVSLLIWLIYRSRVRTLSLRFKAVLEERTRIARAMHDTIIQGCTSISALLEAISSLSGNSSPLEQELIEHARTQVRTTVQEAREAVWDLRHNDDLVPDLDHSITVMAESVGRDTGTAVQCKTEGRAFPISGPPAREIMMVVREAVYNAALHSHPRRIAVDVAFSRADLKVVISDDGVGFVVLDEADTLHYGIAGMRERMQRLGGDLSIESQLNQGTTVRLTMRRSHLQATVTSPTERV